MKRYILSDTSWQFAAEKIAAVFIARAYGVEGIRINSAEEFKPALIKAIESDCPVVLDVPMINNPVPTTGHWNILDIYSPGQDISHVSTD